MCQSAKKPTHRTYSSVNPVTMEVETGWPTYVHFELNEKHTGLLLEFELEADGVKLLHEQLGEWLRRVGEASNPE